MRAAIYARVSTRDKGQDVENQLIQLREYCSRQNWTHAEYIDQASGKTDERQAFKQLFTDGSRRKFDVILVWALDRFTREGVLETFQHIERFRRWGIAFESYTEPHFRTTGPAGELMLAVAAWIAKQERLKIGERTKAGMARAKAQGHIAGRRQVIIPWSRAAKLREKGMSWREVGHKLGIGKSTLFDRLKGSKNASMALCGNGPPSANA